MATVVITNFFVKIDLVNQLHSELVDLSHWFDCTCSLLYNLWKTKLVFIKLKLKGLNFSEIKQVIHQIKDHAGLQGYLFQNFDNFLVTDLRDIQLSFAKENIYKLVLLDVAFISLKDSLEACNYPAAFLDFLEGSSSDAALSHHQESRRSFILIHVVTRKLDAALKLWLNEPIEELLALPEDVVGRSSLVMDHHGLHE